jgi:hypothetical protein
MKIRGFLAILLLTSVLVYLLFFLKTGQHEEIKGDIEAFSAAKIKLTETNMNTLATAVYSFIAGQGRMPKSLQDLQSHGAVGMGLLDAWGTKFRFEKISDDSFRLISAGADKAFDTNDDIKKDY